MLETINSPKDLKKIPVEKLPELSAEIRHRIVSVVSKTGGHLASSLGAVELVIALHYCFNAPKDIIIWDVGHQAYAHKLLTGRNKKFNYLRQYGGLAPFPRADESEYDPFSVGHSSTSISLALGMAKARDLKKTKEKIVAVVGDGSLTGGMCFEALNQAGHLGTDLIVALNTNDMSISQSVGALSNYINKIISLPVYNRVKEAIENFMKLRIPRIGPRLAKVAERFEESLKGMIIPGIFFEELGFRYFGPFDGHNLELLITNLKNISLLEGPILFHVVTTKGKGYEPAEKFPEQFHSASAFDVSTGASQSAMSIPTYTSVFGEYLIELAKKNHKVVAITAAMATGTGLSKFAQIYPKRFFDVGIAEEHAVGFAAGLAKGGFKPFVAIYSTFLQRSYDQISEEACLQNLPIVFCIDRAGLVGEDGPTHHGIFDIVYLRTLPNIVIMAASNKEEFKRMLDFALEHNSPIAIRYPKDIAVDLANTPKPIELGKAEIISKGTDVALFALGSMVEIAQQTRDLLLENDISTTLINARFAKPLDQELILEAAKTHKHIFTLEEGSIDGGFGSAVLELLEESHLLPRVGVYRFGLPCEFITFGPRIKLFQQYGLTPEQIKNKIIHQVSAKNKITLK